MKVFRLKGRIDGVVLNQTIRYIAAAPADVRSSFIASGLPFETPSQAFENTPNSGSLKLGLNNTFDVEIIMPNSYYEFSNDFGKVRVEPSIYITYDDQTVRIKLDDAMPFRALTIQQNSALQPIDPNESQDQWVIFKQTTYPRP